MDHRLIFVALMLFIVPVPANARSLTLTPSVGTGEQNTACLNLSLNLLIFESVVLVVSCCLAVAEFGLTTVRLVAAFSFRFVAAVEIRIVETVPFIAALGESLFFLLKK